MSTPSERVFQLASYRTTDGKVFHDRIEAIRHQCIQDLGVQISQAMQRANQGFTMDECMDLAEQLLNSEDVQNIFQDLHGALR